MRFKLDDKKKKDKMIWQELQMKKEKKRKK